MSSVIRLENVSKSFTQGKKEVEALHNISLEIKQGDVFGIVGLSGAGKSTLVRCINLLERPESGKVFVHDEDFTELTEKELRSRRQKIGMIFQNFSLLSQRTLLGNVCFPMEINGTPHKEAHQKAIDLLKLVGLADRAHDFPAHLSGGQKQRVAIARALAMDPDIILCDEATSALDAITTRSILDLLQKINQEKHITLVVITHQLSVIKQICTHVAVLEQGRIQEQGSVDDVFSNPKAKATKRLLLASELEQEGDNDYVG